MTGEGKMTASRSLETQGGHQLGSKPPRVSVVISAYNKQDYIAEAVSSALAQTEPAVEVIVVDDCSTDATRTIVRGLMAGDGRVKLLALEANVGQPAALNAGIAAATGEWVAILDGDDWVAPDLYCSLIEAAERHGVSVVSSDMQWVADGRMDPWRRLLSAGRTKPLIVGVTEFIRHSMPYQMRPFSFLQPVVRRALLISHGIRYDESDRFDLDFGILVRCILAGGPMLVLPKIGYFYRQVPGSMMSTRGVEVLRHMKGANDALLEDCEHSRDATAAAWIRRRSRAVAREIARAELASAIRGRQWGQAVRRALASPAHLVALCWRRLRGRLYWAWRRWATVLRIWLFRRSVALGAVTLHASCQTEAQIGVLQVLQFAVI